MHLTFAELFSMALGVLSIAAVVGANLHLFRMPGISGLEAVYYLTALAALIIGWYFNFEYMRTYGDQVSWVNWTELLFANPASASGGQDLVIANLVLFPLWTIIDGRRIGMRWAWLYFPMSLVTSYAFGVALYLALRDRQVRLNRGGGDLALAI